MVGVSISLVLVFLTLLYASSWWIVLINQTDFKLNQWSQESYFTNDFEFKFSEHGYRFAVSLMDTYDGFENVDRYDADYADFYLMLVSWDYTNLQYI